MNRCPDAPKRFQVPSGGSGWGGPETGRHLVLNQVDMAPQGLARRPRAAMIARQERRSGDRNAAAVRPRRRGAGGASLRRPASVPGGGSAAHRAAGRQWPVPASERAALLELAPRDLGVDCLGEEAGKALVAFEMGSRLEGCSSPLTIATGHVERDRSLASVSRGAPLRRRLRLPRRLRGARRAGARHGGRCLVDIGHVDGRGTCFGRCRGRCGPVLTSSRPSGASLPARGVSPRSSWVRRSCHLLLLRDSLTGHYPRHDLLRDRLQIVSHGGCRARREAGCLGFTPADLVPLGSVLHELMPGSCAGGAGARPS